MKTSIITLLIFTSCTAGFSWAQTVPSKDEQEGSVPVTSKVQSNAEQSSRSVSSDVPNALIPKKSSDNIPRVVTTNRE